MSDVYTFMETIFANKPVGTWILVWLLSSERSVWFRDWSGAARFCFKKQDESVHVGAGFSPRDFGPAKRCSPGEIAGITSLWVDIDIAHEVHKKRNLPPTENEAVGLLTSIEVEPTLVINTGHGIHAWWCFDKAWLFNDDDRDLARRMLINLQGVIRLKAYAQGWGLDATHDLSRVMRVAGTTNIKDPDHPVLTKIISVSGKRYPRDRFSYLMSEEISHAVGEHVSGDSSNLTNIIFTLNGNAEADKAKLEIMCVNVSGFLDTWKRERKDKPAWTDSEYDMSLAYMCLHAEWSDQEIVNLLIASRREFGVNRKVKSDQYYQRTISKVKNGLSSDQATDLLVDTPKIGYDLRKIDILDHLSSLLGITVTRIVKYTGSNPVYAMYFGDVGIDLGSVEHLIGQTQLRHRIAAGVNHIIPPLKSETWYDVQQVLVHVCEEVERGPEATTLGVMESWLGGYMRSITIYRDQIEKASDSESPFVKNSCVHIFASSLKKWLSLEEGEKVKYSDLATMLKNVGAVSLRERLGSRQVRVWKLPAYITEEILEDTNKN